MKIDNFESAAKYRLYFPVLLLISISFTVYFFIDNASYKYIWLIMGVLVTILYVVLLFRKPHYFGFETKQNSIVIRFFNPHPFVSKRKAFEIPINHLDKYEIYEKSLGIRNIVFFVKKSKKQGAYPPISITLLSDRNLDILKKELDTILKIKKFK